MVNKIEITAQLKVITGMHIGGSNEFAAIGAVDAPVVRDALTRKPMLPGSSLKGKLRTLMSRQKSELYAPVDFNHDDKIVKRLFGSAKDREYRTARLIFSDSVLANENEIKERGAQRSTEVKFENYINRLTAVATPRQIERVIPGCVFNISIIYNAVSDDRTEAQEIKEDFEALIEAFKLLEYDYLGGSGTRGYGKVRLENIVAKPLFGEMSRETAELFNKLRGNHHGV